MANVPFSPVVLYRQDAEAVFKALASSGNSELAEMIRRKASRSRLDKIYANSIKLWDDATFDVDDEPVVSQGDGGAYVMTWQWVDKSSIQGARI